MAVGLAYPAALALVVLGAGRPGRAIRALLTYLRDNPPSPGV
jgi:hypothetical protein